MLAFSDNCIDGVALIGLKDDFTEFKEMVPESGLRLKLKRIDRQWSSHDPGKSFK